MKKCWLGLLIFLQFISVIYSTCAGIYPPFETLPTTTFDYKQMETCCWYSSNTCCGVRNQVYDLSSINDQIKDLSERGLEPDCYVALTGLMCIWCDPNTSEFIGKPNNPEYIFPTAYAYLCPSYCDELFFKCFDDLDELVNDKTFLGSSIEFCEDIILDNFFPNTTDIYPNLRFKVTETNSYCFDGGSSAKIEDAEGICIPTPGKEKGDHNPLVYGKGGAAMLSVNLFLFVIIFLLI